MSVLRALICLVTLCALAACGSGTADKAAPARATPSTGAPAPAAASPSAPSPSPPPAASPSPTADTRKAAAAYVARQPGTLGIVVRDRVTGEVWRAGETKATTWTASTIKLAIAADLLERHRAGQIALTAADRADMGRALIDSSNDATTALWNAYDGAGMLERFRGRYGMTGLSVVPGYEPFWRNLLCGAEDLQALMSYVLDELAPDDRAYLVTTLRKVASSQHWGVWAAGPALRPGNKDGWAQKPTDGRTHWVTHSVGFAGDAERYVVAVVYRLTPAGTLSTGVHTVSDLVATYFAQKLPAKVTMPPP